jgi:hypothetical protein
MSDGIFTKWLRISRAEISHFLQALGIADLFKNPYRFVWVLSEAFVAAKDVRNWSIVIAVPVDVRDIVHAVSKV